MTITVGHSILAITGTGGFALKMFIELPITEVRSSINIPSIIFNRDSHLIAGSTNHSLVEWDMKKRSLLLYMCKSQLHFFISIHLFTACYQVVSGSSCFLSRLERVNIPITPFIPTLITML